MFCWKGHLRSSLIKCATPNDSQNVILSQMYLVNWQLGVLSYVCFSRYLEDLLVYVGLF